MEENVSQNKDQRPESGKRYAVNKETMPAKPETDENAGRESHDTAMLNCIGDLSCCIN